MHIFQHLKPAKHTNQIQILLESMSLTTLLESFVEEVGAADIFEKLDKDILSDPTKNYNIIEKKNNSGR